MGCGDERSAASLGGMLQMSMKDEDLEKGWIGLVAKAFDADMHGIAISGTQKQKKPIKKNFRSPRKGLTLQVNQGIK